MKQALCNKDLLTDVKMATGESAADISSVVDFFSQFIADTIREGAFEGVLVPHFGKFQPKVTKVQWRAERQGGLGPKATDT